MWSWEDLIGRLKMAVQIIVKLLSCDLQLCWITLKHYIKSWKNLYHVDLQASCLPQRRRRSKTTVFLKCLGQEMAKFISHKSSVCQVHGKLHLRARLYSLRNNLLLVKRCTNRFNNQQLYALPTLYLCVLYLSENKEWLVPLTA